MNRYEFNVRIAGSMTLEVEAENRDEAKRILDDTIASITDKTIKEELTKIKNVEYKESKLKIKLISEKEKER